MASREAKEINRSQKGRTGPKTIDRRKKLGLKARVKKEASLKKAKGSK